MIPAIQGSELIKVWLVGFLSVYDSEETYDTINKIHDVAAFGTDYDPQEDSDAYDGSVTAFEAGIDAARKMVDGDQIYSVSFADDDGVNIQSGAVYCFWFVGKSEQAVIDSLEEL
jgi:hypothetical protein